MTDRTPEDTELRDTFALAAMLEIWRDMIQQDAAGIEEGPWIAAVSYRMADAMMAERMRT